VGEATSDRNWLPDTFRGDNDLGERATDAHAPGIEFSSID
jgi:hypothetical protein